MEETIQEKPKTILSHRVIDVMQIFELDHKALSDTREMMMSILSNNTIHKTPRRTIPGFAWYNS